MNIRSGLPTLKSGELDTQLFYALLNEYQRVPVVELPSSVPGGVTVTVCVPTYRHARSIEKCLDSILEQETDFTYEILIGEDGSTDGTRELCAEYSSKYPERIRLFLHSRDNNIEINGYATGRFNLLYLLSKANGEYIALCEGDDWWTDKNKLQTQVRAMSGSPGCNVSCHAAYAESARYSGSGGLIGYRGTEQKIIPAADVILSGGGFCATLAIMFRRTVIRKLPDWLILAPVMDYYLLALAAAEGGCLYIPITVGVYGHCAASESWTNRVLANPKFAIDFEISFLEYLEKLGGDVGPDNRPAVEYLRKTRMESILFAEHLPRHYRAAVYREIKRGLNLKLRFAWYLSGFGLFPALVWQINKHLKSLGKYRIRAN